MQGVDGWFQNEAADDQVVLTVLAQNNQGSPPTVAQAKSWRDSLSLQVEVLADDGTWLDAWGASNGSQHTYAVVNSHGVITWRQADGSAAGIAQLLQAADDAE